MYYIWRKDRIRSCLVKLEFLTFLQIIILSFFFVSEIIVQLLFNKMLELPKCITGIVQIFPDCLIHFWGKEKPSLDHLFSVVNYIVDLLVQLHT